LQIAKPQVPQKELLQNLQPDWFALLHEFVLHKRLTIDKIATILSCDNAQARSQVLALLRSGIIVEKASGIYHINTYVNPYLIEAMRERKIIN
jgi:predicted transcriptional regulator